MKTFKVWCPEEGQTIENAETFTECRSASDAAEQYAYRAYQDGEQFHEMEVHVMEFDYDGTSKGDVRAFTVDAEVEVNFSACEVS